MEGPSNGQANGVIVAPALRRLCSQFPTSMSLLPAVCCRGLK